MLVATHPGTFHADDVFAVATLGLALGPFDLVRTRDRARLAEADLRVDVGGASDPATGDFDHHQRGGAGERANGIRYASFGLVWREHGARLAGGEEPARAIDERLVQGVDANDTGQTIAEALVADIRPMTASGLVGAMNPSWDEPLDPAQEDARFGEAVAWAARRAHAGARGLPCVPPRAAARRGGDRPQHGPARRRARPEPPLARGRRDRRARGALRRLPQERGLGPAGRPARAGRASPTARTSRRPGRG